MTGSELCFCDTKTLDQGPSAAPDTQLLRASGRRFILARPQKAAGDKRTLHMPPVRMTAAELALLEEQASATGLSVSEYARQRLLTGQVKTARPKESASILVELSRVGNNLNQIARQLNRGRAHDPHHLDYVLGELVKVLHRQAGA